MAVTDRALLSRLHQGDFEVMTPLVQRHFFAVFYRAWQLSGSAERAEEITSDVFIALWNEPPPASERGPLRRWLLVTTEQLIRNYPSSAP
jgi:DNA-directed RNA polymerase specialized sigma24 family protein